MDIGILGVFSGLVGCLFMLAHESEAAQRKRKPQAFQVGLCFLAFAFFALLLGELGVRLEVLK